MHLVLGNLASPELEADDTVGEEHHHERQHVDKDDHREVVPGGKGKGLGMGRPGSDFCIRQRSVSLSPLAPLSQLWPATRGHLPRP